jgi:hypothetical protein
VPLFEQPASTKQYVKPDNRNSARLLEFQVQQHNRMVDSVNLQVSNIVNEANTLIRTYNGKLDLYGTPVR